MLKTITVNQIHKWGPCSSGVGEPYSRENLRKLFGGDSITPLAVCDLDIPAEDILWVLLRPEILSERNLRLLAADYAEHVLPIAANCTTWDAWAARAAKHKWQVSRLKETILGAST